MSSGRVLFACTLALVSAACADSDPLPTAQASVVAARPSNPRCVAPAEGAPALLSELGCFDPSNPRVMSAGVLEYEPQAPLWSDGTGKPRYLAIPDATTIHVEDNGHFTFPGGTVLFKSFVHGDRLVETRVLFRYSTGTWGAYSYEWNDAQTDATRLDAAKQKDLGGLTWTFPNRRQCFNCHNQAAGVTLGPEVAQLNGPLDTRVANQLEKLAGSGYLDAPLVAPVASLPRLARYEDSSAALEDRARAYLHGNCAHCHQPGGTGYGSADYRFSTAFATMGICDEPARTSPTAKLFAPGSSQTSLISVRMHALDGTRMPMIGSAVVDPVGTSLVDRWIDATPSCTR